MPEITRSDAAARYSLAGAAAVGALSLAGISLTNLLSAGGGNLFVALIPDPPITNDPPTVLPPVTYVPQSGYCNLVQDGSFECFPYCPNDSAPQPLVNSYWSVAWQQSFNGALVPVGQFYTQSQSSGRRSLFHACASEGNSALYGVVQNQAWRGLGVPNNYLNSYGGFWVYPSGPNGPVQNFYYLKVAPATTPSAFSPASVWKVLTAATRAGSYTYLPGHSAPAAGGSPAGRRSPTTRAEKLRLSVAPNPAHETVQVSWSLPCPTAARLELVAVGNGQLVQTQALAMAQQRLELGVAALPPGVYAARLVGPNGQLLATAKLVVVH